MKVLEEIVVDPCLITLLKRLDLDGWSMNSYTCGWLQKLSIVLKWYKRFFPLRYVLIHMFTILDRGRVAYYILMKPYDLSMLNVFKISPLPCGQIISPCNWILHPGTRSTNVVEWNRKVDTSFDVVTKILGYLQMTLRSIFQISL